MLINLNLERNFINMKRILAILMALMLIVSCFTACSIKDAVEEIEGTTKSFVVDDEGVTQEVYVDEDGNFYYTDENGNKQVVNMDDVIHEADEKLEMTEDLVEENIVVDNSTPVSTAKAEAESRMKPYSDLLKSDKFTIRGTMKQKDGDVMEFPLLYIRNGADFCIEAEVPFEDGKAVKARVINLNGTAYCAIPAMSVYYVVDDGEELDDFGAGTFSDEMLKEYDFAETGTVTLNGKSYICDVYNYDGETHKYYFDSNNQLVRIEEIYSAKSYLIVEVKEMSSNVDTSKIKKPSGVNITGMM